MRSFITAGAVIAASISGTTADLCYSGPGGSSIAQQSPPDNPNWYCAPVKAITYQGVGTSGSYKQVTSMTEEGQCQFSDKPFSGGMAPLAEEVSFSQRLFEDDRLLTWILFSAIYSFPRSCEIEAARRIYERLQPKER